jgi:hypothetical protein
MAANTKQYRKAYVTVTGIQYRVTTEPTSNPDRQVMTLKMMGTRYPSSSYIINTSDKLATAAKAEINSWLNK